MQPTPARFARAAACGAVALLFFTGAHPAAAAPLSTNDACESAFVLPGGGPFPYWTPVMDISNATNYPDPFPDCATNSTHGVWFKFTPDTNALYTLSVGADTATTINDTVMAAYTSPSDCAGPFTNSFLCDDDLGYKVLQQHLSSGF